MSDGDDVRLIRRGWRATPRVLRWLILGVPSVFVGFLLLCNIMLWTGAIEAIASRRHAMARINLEMGPAYTLWPGKLHVRDFHLDVDSYFYHLHLDIPEGEADIAMLDLVTRRFHTRSVHGDDATLWLVLKKPSERVDEADLDGLPQIADFGAPILDPEPPEIPAYEDSWVIDVDGIEGQLRDLRIDHASVDFGAAQLRGSVHAVPGHEFSVAGARLDLEDTSVALDEREVIRALALELSLDVAEYNPFELKGRDVLAQLTASAQGGGDIVDVAPLAGCLPESAEGVALGGGAGELSVDVGLDAGVIEVGSDVRYASEALRVYAGEVVLGASVELRADVDRGPISRVAVDLDHVHGGVAGERGDAVRAGAVEARLELAQNDLSAASWPIHDVLLSIPSVEIERLAALDGITDAVGLEGGAAELSWETTREPDGRYATAARVKLSDGAFALDGTKVHSSARIEVAARTGADLGETSIHALDVDVDGLDLATSRGASQDTWVRIDGGWINIDHERGSINAKLRGRLDDLRPVLAQSGARKALSTQVRDLDLTKPLDFDLVLFKHRRTLVLDIEDLSRPGLNVRGKVRRRGDETRFAILLELAHIGVSGEAGAKPKIELAVGDDWLSRRSAWVGEG